MTDFAERAAQRMASSVATDLIVTLCNNAHTSALISSIDASVSALPPLPLPPLPPARCEQVRADVQLLSALSKDLKGVRYPPRAAHYLDAVFPYRALQKTLKRHPDPTACRQAMGEDAFSHHLLELTEAIHALVRLKRLLSPPESWDKESKIFEREQAYARAVKADPEFQRIAAAFFKAFPQQCPDDWQWGGTKTEPRRLEILSSMPRRASRTARDPDWEFQQGDYHQMYERLDMGASPTCAQPLIDVICHLFCIRAFSGEDVLPQLFDLRVQDRSLLVIVPNYLQLNWARDLPTDVIAVLQQHGDSIYRRTKPNMYNDALSDVSRFEQWRLFIFCVVFASHQDSTIQDLYEFIRKHQMLEVPLTETDDVDEANPTIQRTMRKLFAKHDVSTLAKDLDQSRHFANLLAEFRRRYPSEKIPPGMTKACSLLAALRQAPSKYFADRTGDIWKCLVAIRGLK